MISIASKIKNAGMYQFYYSGHSDRVRKRAGGELYKNVYNKYFVIANTLNRLTGDIAASIGIGFPRIELIENE
jgi:hypothetical protein